MKIGMIQVLACVGPGMMFGLVAGSRDITPGARAAALTPKVGLAANSRVTNTAGNRSPCCSDVIGKDLLLARADGGHCEAVAQPGAMKRFLELEKLLSPRN
jgi:hypothetical protein